MDKHDSDGLDPKVRALLSAAKPVPPVPAPLEDRLWEKVSQLSSAAATTATTAVGLASTKLLSIGLGIGLTVGGVGGWGAGYYWAERDRPQPTLVATVPAVETPLPPAPAPAAPAAQHVAPQRTKQKVVAPAPVHGAEEQFDLERGLLDQARAAIQRGRPADARRALAGLDSQFPNGALTEEREALAVQACVVAGELERAKAEAESFRRKWPNSLFQAGLDQLLEPLDHGPP